MTEPGSPTRALALGILLISCALLAGCAGGDGGGEDEQPAPGVRQGEDCLAETSEDERSSGAQLACRNAAGGVTHEQPFACPDAERSAVSMAANLSAGAITVTVLDDASATVFERTYDETGEIEDSQDIDEGESGQWLLRVDRSEELEGAFGVRAACAR